MNLNPHSLSNDEVEVLEFLGRDRSVTFLSSTEQIRKYLVLKSFMIQKLTEGKTFIIRANNKSQTLQLLEQWGLIALSLELKKDTSIDKDLLEKTQPFDLDFQIEAIKANTNYLRTLQRLKSTQLEYNEPVFGEYPRSKLSELLFLSNKRQIKYKLDLDVSARNYLYNQKEFWHIRGKIEKAAKYYKTTYNYLKSSDEFADDIYHEFHLAENQEIIFKYLNKFLHYAESLSEAYRNAFQKIGKELYDTYRAKVSILTRLAEDLENHLSYYQIELDLAPKKNVFSRGADPLENAKLEVRSRYQLIIETIAETQVFKINCPENSWNPDVSTLTKFTIDLQKLLKNAHLTIQSKVEEQLEILNANNYHAPGLVEINERQQDLIQSINGSKLFKNEMHSLSISSWKNYGFVRKLISRLRKSKVFIEANMNYAIYRSFEFSLDQKVRDIIKTLENVKHHLWVDSFEAWYFKALFDKNFIHDLIGIESKYDLLEEYKYINKNYEPFRIASVFDRLKYQRNTIQKKVGKEGLDWKSAFIADPAGFKSYFPIIVCDENFFPSEISNLKYNHLICLENTDIPLNLFANSHFYSIICLNKSTPTKAILENAYSAKNYPTKKQFHLKSKGIPEDLRLNDSLKYNLTMAKYLTYILMQTNFEKHFYSARDFSVVTCMSDFCTKLLEIEMLEHRIKSLKYTHIESGIVDDIVIKEDKSKYLIIQDGFLDPKIDLEWQVSVLRNLRSAGIKVLTVSSFELAMSKNGSILSLLDIRELESMKNSVIANEA